jgi:putative ABC transport system substrate-binding protein
MAAGGARAAAGNGVGWLVPSFNRPGGNITGVTFPVSTLAPKRLELLRQLLLRVTLVGFLANSTNPAAQSQTKDAQAAALALGLELLVLNASSERASQASLNSGSKRYSSVLMHSS